ncbi:hypothetical protein ACU8KH_01240 [Lachancea thermotolerans]
MAGSKYVLGIALAKELKYSLKSSVTSSFSLWPIPLDENGHIANNDGKKREYRAVSLIKSILAFFVTR